MRAHIPFSGPIALLFILILLMMGLPSALSAAENSHNAGYDHSPESFNRTDSLAKIRPVLEKRLEDKVLAQKAKDKLSVLSADKIKLISSLCERISHDSHSAGADLAFFLVTTLIIFS